MNLSMFDRFCPILKGRVQLEERIDQNNKDRNRERYVIHMHKKDFWTNKWMQEPIKNFFRLQVQHCDPSVQYKRSWEMYKRKRGLCYNPKLHHTCRPGIRPSYLLFFPSQYRTTLLKNTIFEDVRALHHYCPRMYASCTTTAHVRMLAAPLQPAYTHKSCKK
jgi:hypothetical protein